MSEMSNEIKTQLVLLLFGDDIEDVEYAEVAPDNEKRLMDMGKEKVDSGEFAAARLQTIRYSEVVERLPGDVLLWSYGNKTKLDHYAEVFPLI